MPFQFAKKIVERQRELAEGVGNHARGALRYTLAAHSHKATVKKRWERKDEEKRPPRRRPMVEAA
jgi:hypothetical protein